MSTIDILFVAAFAAILLALLAASPVVRAILWDTLRHPFTHARVESDGSQVRVLHLEPPARDSAGQGKASSGVC
jgi:hypothetical protein